MSSSRHLFSRSFLIDYNAHYLPREALLKRLSRILSHYEGLISECRFPSEESLWWELLSNEDDQEWPESLAILEILGVSSVTEMPFEMSLEGWGGGGIDGSPSESSLRE